MKRHMTINLITLVRERARLWRSEILGKILDKLVLNKLVTFEYYRTQVRYIQMSAPFHRP